MDRDTKETQTWITDDNGYVKARVYPPVAGETPGSVNKGSAPGTTDTRGNLMCKVK